MALFYRSYKGISTTYVNNIPMKFPILFGFFAKITPNIEMLRLNEFIYLILMKIPQSMTIKILDKIKMPFLSFWLTMARVINVHYEM